MYKEIVFLVLDDNIINYYINETSLKYYLFTSLMLISIKLR